MLEYFIGVLFAFIISAIYNDFFAENNPKKEIDFLYILFSWIVVIFVIVEIIFILILKHYGKINKILKPSFKNILNSFKSKRKKLC
jgi:hypothetical protein